MCQRRKKGGGGGGGSLLFSRQRAPPKSRREQQHRSETQEEKGTHQVLRLDARQHRAHVPRRVRQRLHPHDPFEHRGRVAVRRAAVDHAGRVDQKHALGERHVLPHFRLPWHWRRLAHGLGAQGVDHGRLAHVGVADEADADGLLVRAQARELAQQREQRAAAKGVRERGVEGEGGVLAREGVEPALGDPRGDLFVVVGVVCV